MSDATDVVAPEADPAVLAELGAPGDVEAVDTESAELRKRFNGLMAKHQSALDALVQEREARIQAEARLQEVPEPVSEDNATLTEVQALRAELQEARLAAAKAEALQTYPDAAAFADLITGKTPSDVMAVTRAFAERAATLRAPEATPAPEPVTLAPQPPAAPAPVPQAVGVPMTAGGGSAPTQLAEASQAREDFNQLRPSQDGNPGAWDSFWVAHSVVNEAEGLA